VAGRNPGDARAADLGYAIAPRLNAAGRLDDMTIGVQCLLAGDADEACTLAGELERLNRERRTLQDRMQDEASSLLDGLEASGAGIYGSSCLFDERWHAGVIGLVASRIRERTGQPAIAFARAMEPGMLRGSARSIEGLHVRDAIAAALARLPHLTIRFGGHAMAAGLSLPEAELPAFRQAFAAELARQQAGSGGPEVLW
ncbi:MAG: single-stranded-DNA-specific exonuclease RecJ, partial [Gammaproteobacteria bacterium]|nr:single-stranded-DNA-specific exonuclease RecJ [Gammaproteobacteria bacterium]